MHNGAKLALLCMEKYQVTDTDFEGEKRKNRKIFFTDWNYSSGSKF